MAEGRAESVTTDRNAIRIRPATAADKPFIRAELQKWWGDETMVVRGQVYHPAEYDGFIAEWNGTESGLILLRFERELCEIMSLSTSTESPPIGNELVAAAIKMAREKGAHRLIAVTTNDNISALRFYQQLGFTIYDWRINAVERARTLKPQIPLVGNYHIPIRDEIELELII
jgi:N-acetylglutamate synthase-like GNAT family acetyltransferase